MLDVMDITPFTADDAAALETWTELYNAIGRVDSPWEHPVTPKIGAGRFTYGWDGEPDSPYLATVDGAVVGWGSIATSEYDNLDLAWLCLQVHPEHRRQGHGSAILEALTAAAAARGRHLLGSDGWESAATEAFAVRHGFVPKLRSINRRQFLADVDHAALSATCDEALPHATDYRIERWAVPTPPADLPALTAMASAINDAPTDDLDYEDEVFSVERMVAYETAITARDQRLYRLVARHLPSGELAAQTVVAVEADHPERGHQHDTSVTRAHRGHRLGLLLKTDMLRWLAEAEPQLTEIDTWNAESNDHMIGVNEMLGYQIMGREIAYQRSVRD